MKKSEWFEILFVVSLVFACSFALLGLLYLTLLSLMFSVITALHSLYFSKMRDDEDG